MAIMRVTFASEVLCRYIDLNVIVPMETPGLPGAEEKESAIKKNEKSLRPFTCFMDTVVIRTTG